MGTLLGSVLMIAGAPVWFQAAGEGPAVLFLHAGIADSRMWDAEFDSLQPTHRVVRFDLRGFGRSPFPPDRFSNRGDVIALLDSLGIDRATLVGCSFGSLVALEVAVEHPDRVAGLVLVSPSVGDGDTDAEVRAFGEREEAALERGDLDAAVEENLRMWVDGPHREPEQVDAAVRQRIAVMQRAAFQIPVPEGLSVDRLQPPARDRLSDVKAPTLIVAGSLDVTHVLRTASRLEREIPGARLATVPGAAHVPTLERPDVWQPMLADFLGSLPTPGAAPGPTPGRPK